MNSLDALLSELMQTIPQCVAAAWVDLDSGLALSVQTVQAQPQGMMDLLAGAKAELEGAV